METNSMKIVRIVRRILGISLLSVSFCAHAAYPDKPIRIVVPFSTGGTGGVLINIVADRLSADLGQPVVIDYKTGASGNIAAQYVAGAPADGYTLLLGTISILTINPPLFG